MKSKKYDDVVIKVPVNKNGSIIVDKKGFVHVAGQALMGMNVINKAVLGAHYERV